MGRPLIEITEKLCKKAESLAAQGLNREQIAHVLGLGIKLISELSKMYKEDKNRIRIITSAPSLIFGLKNNKNWIMVKKPSRMHKSGNKTDYNNISKKISANRLTATFEYSL